MVKMHFVTKWAGHILVLFTASNDRVVEIYLLAVLAVGCLKIICVKLFQFCPFHFKEIFEVFSTQSVLWFQYCVLIKLSAVCRGCLKLFIT